MIQIVFRAGLLLLVACVGVFAQTHGTIQGTMAAKPLAGLRRVSSSKQGGNYFRECRDPTVSFPTAERPLSRSRMQAVEQAPGLPKA